MPAFPADFETTFKQVTPVDCLEACFAEKGLFFIDIEIFYGILSI